MASTFQTTLADIVSDAPYFQSHDEKNTELGVILPLLDEVGWNTKRMSEINPQRGLPGGGIVDFDLQIDGESQILIEVKSWGNTLTENNENQLANYCRLVKPKLAVLTSGRNWQLYLPTKQKGEIKERKFLDLDITNEPSEIESKFRQFLARDSIVKFNPTNHAANGLLRERRGLDRLRKVLNDTWNGLVHDKDNLAEVILWLLDGKPIEPNLDDILHIIEEPGYRNMMNEVPARPPTPPKKPGSFDLPNSPNHKTKVNHKVKKHNGWNNCRLEICELMQERHPQNFRENLLSMPDLFSEDGNAKLLISDSGIYVTGIYTWAPARAACYATIEKFGYSEDSLVIRDSQGNPV